MELSGNTRFLSLFDVVQVLAVNEATGMLRVESEDGKGFLYFQGGDVINAMDPDLQEGEAAAKRIFAHQPADFSFRTDLPSVAHRIDCSPQNLMMEIARQLDEEGAGDGSQLAEAQQATSVLNELFTQLDSESRLLARRSPEGFSIGELLEPIRDAADSTLFLRAGAAPEVGVDGRGIPVSPTALDDKGYRGLRDAIVREAGIRTDLGGTSGVLRAAEDELYRVDLLRTCAGELVALRRLPGPEQLDAGLPWSDDELRAALPSPGSLVCLVAPDAAARERTTQALARWLLRSGTGPFAGLARTWPPGLETGHAGALLLSSADDRESVPELLDALRPGAFVLEDAQEPDAFRLLERAGRHPARLVAGFVGREPMPALDAWRHADDARSRAAWLGTRLSAFLWAAPEGARVLPADDELREALRRGDFREAEARLRG